MDLRRGRVLTVLVAAVVGAAVGALVARWVFGETDLASVWVIAGAAAAASGAGASIRARRVRRTSS